MAASYNGVAVPANGARITYSNGRYQIPDNPIVPLSRAMARAGTSGKRRCGCSTRRSRRPIRASGGSLGTKCSPARRPWRSSIPGFRMTASNAIREFRVAIKGPLTTPVGGGIRSLECCATANSRPLLLCAAGEVLQGRAFARETSRAHGCGDYRENTEDVYAGIEWEQGTPEAARLIEFLNKDMLKGGKKQVRLDSGVGIKPISISGTKRLVRMAIQLALESGRKSVTLVHKGNIQKFTEGAFRKWGYELATQEFRDQVVTERESWILDNKDKNANLSAEENANLVEPGLEFATEEFRQEVYKEVKEVLDTIYATHGRGAWKKKLMINDRIADSIFQQVVTRADEYTVLATPNLNGDYISDACAAQVGGLGIAPGANIGDGYAIFEATHGTAPKYADKDVINPGSVILSGVMMFRFLGWNEAADLIERGMERTIEQKKVTYDFERLMEGATKVKTSEFGDYIIENMDAVMLAGVR